ncbi:MULTISPECIES: ABC transporter ATP-binding protein [unclassified Streptomyces]|uniref:ABC transporter ATP-binding protein n=1 Tax=unclassified Streptomyces TaxID=2593676 RepID=UPI0022382610|nr:ABC transporter ATP-binding protein [Streptomyces sp. SHP 1-2]MCW5249554.1 ABC transporter ATP-binding protein [Streptomyces sp. SHP 1-2]
MPHTNTTEPVAVTTPAASESVLEFDRVTVEYKTPMGGVNRVLDGISLDVRRGEFCVLVGTSGCGKSTMLNLAAGLIEPTDGEVRQDGRPVSGVNTRIGYVTQDANLMPWKTVRENLMLPLAIRNWPADERAARVERWIETVGLAGYADHYPHELSGGMQKRASIARTLVYDPEIILMDEPFGALDAMTKVVMQDELLRIWQEARKTIVFITHDLTEAIALADRVVAMGKHPGRVKEVLDVRLPRPRDVFHLMDNREATEMHDRLWELMRDQITDGSNR